ncbi:unnamed protein product [Rotaria sp. Silwood1]|nr:unnamed protein product [Rotaria sp. Silwood1]CAF3478722.1 unnamed protein product [Rotaria sp. Silwood1]CAF3512771.1 unnamed protein product [Rotaria sp. Silwood1]CAF3544691.1 unnamed protein product [Rotaria sp. Silwood1]CAF4719657.1 unnamed protein product [Rotaria sp. Silwood1]
MSLNSILCGFKQILPTIIPPAYEQLITGQDLTIRFLSAENLPKMDLVGTSDTYFIAKLDEEISYTQVYKNFYILIYCSIFNRSMVVSNTLSPEWNDEEWIVRNVPLNAKLTINIYDKDDDSLSDDHIGQVEITDLPNYQAPSEGHEILGLLDRNRGQFHLTIQSIESSESSKKLPRYTFDGPCTYSRHNSPTVGYLTMLNQDAIYSTWKIRLRRISVFFPLYERQQWNRKYRIAQTLFSGTPRSIAKQHVFKLAHKILYGRTIKNNESGRLNNVDDLWKLIFFDDKTQKIRTCIYTYIIDDNTWRFSETGIGFFTDYASKHALHANCSEYVRYAGQFHPRPKYGWNRCDDEWELVFDNWSGTYAPHANLLKNLKELLEFNFPGLNIIVYDFKNPLLQESMDNLKLFEEQTKRDSICVSNLVFKPTFNSIK